MQKFGFTARLPAGHPYAYVPSAVTPSPPVQLPVLAPQPGALSGLALWLRVDDINAVFTTGAITTWFNQAPTGTLYDATWDNWAYSTAPRMLPPMINENSIAGWATAWFPGQGSLVSPLGLVNTPFTVFVLASMNDPVAPGGVILSSSASTWYLGWGGGSQDQYVSSTFSNGVYPGTPTVPGQWILYEATRDATGMTALYNWGLQVRGRCYVYALNLAF